MLSRRDFVVTSLLAAGSAGAALAQPAGGRYVGDLILRPLPDGRLMEVQQAFGYIDPAGGRWDVPAKAIVDGASIPTVLWPIVGGPWEGQYRAASVVHDWFCAVRTKPWQQVHRMFYDAMLTSQVRPSLARLLFLAVRYAGPSWDELTMRNARILTRNGAVRLEPPGRRPVTSGFASQEDEASARRALLAEFERLAGSANEKGLSAAEMEALVDRTGRREDVAAMLSS